MKRLLIMRHAKSSWSSSATTDHGRPLNDRGMKDAPKIGKQLEKLGFIPDYVLCSEAKRAEETWQFLSAQLQKKVPVQFSKEIYQAGPNELLSLISSQSDSVETLMVIGHNPTCEEVTEQLSGRFIALKTANVAVFNCQVNSWKDAFLKTSKLQFLDLIAPKPGS